MRKRHTKHDRLREGGSLDLLIMTWVYRIALLLVMIAGIVWFKVLPIRLMSDTCLGVLFVYACMMIVLQRVYRACDVGQVRISDMVMSQTLTNVISAGAVYVAVLLYWHHAFNPMGLLMVVAVQFLVSVLWSFLMNRSYYLQRRKPKTVVFCRNDDEYALLCSSLYFREKYDVMHVVTEMTDDMQVLRSQLDGCEVAFAMSLPTTCSDNIAQICLEKGIKGYFVPTLGHIIMAGASHTASFSVPLLQVERAGGHSEYRFFKRWFDLLFSVVGLIVLSPVMLMTAIAIWAEDHGPVFYRQIRLTKDGQEFKILKFRSMTVNAEKDGIARLAGENDSRITKVGRFIRACRIDELPQLINILLGDMSLVGPRPERPEIASQYEETLPEFALRLQVKAGLTGIAQVYGRYNTQPHIKLQMDLMYINEMSLLKDLQLILATLKILFVKDSTQGVEQGQKTALGKQSKSA